MSRAQCAHNLPAQATLPINCGGLGVRRSVQLAPSAFLASAAASSHLIQKVLPTRLSVSSYAPKDVALHFWCQSVDTSPPSPPNDKKQRAWDEPQIAVSFQSLLDVSDSSKMRARHLAASVKESGAWIQALPISAVGLRMTDDEVQTAAALRLGAPVPCATHTSAACVVVMWTNMLLMVYPVKEVRADTFAVPLLI